MQYRYRINIFCSNLDNCFLAEVPDLPGCIADGESYEEALANVQEAVKVWVYTAKEMKRHIPDWC